MSEFLNLALGLPPDSTSSMFSALKQHSVKEAAPQEEPGGPHRLSRNVARSWSISRHLVLTQLPRGQLLCPFTITPVPSPSSSSAYSFFLSHHLNFIVPFVLPPASVIKMKPENTELYSTSLCLRPELSLFPLLFHQVSQKLTPQAVSSPIIHHPTPEGREYPGPCK